MKLWIDVPRDSAEDNRVDAEPVDHQLRIHRRIDHALPREGEDKVPTIEIDLVKASPIDHRALDPLPFGRHLRLDRLQFRLERRQNGNPFRFNRLDWNAPQKKDNDPKE